MSLVMNKSLSRCRGKPLLEGCEQRVVKPDPPGVGKAHLGLSTAVVIGHAYRTGTIAGKGSSRACSRLASA